jgi:hypothetical protein
VREDLVDVVERSVAAGEGERERRERDYDARVRAAVLLLTIAIAAPAAAGTADDIVSRPLVLPAGGWLGSLAVETGLSTNLAGEPTSIAPDLWYGATDRLTVGVVHSADALSLVGAGDGVCLGGGAHGCEQAYSNLGLDARWSLARGEWSAAARVRVVTRRWSPWLPSVRIGALVRWQRGRVAVTSDPQLQIGLDNTDLGNRNAVHVPVWISVQPAPRVEAYLRTGVDGDIAVFDDAWGVPLTLGARAAITDRIDLAAEGGFVRLGGPLGDAKQRVAWIAIRARWP